MIPIAKPNIGAQVIKDITKILKSGNLAQGFYVKRFEDLFKKYQGSKYAIATSSGTAALHLAILALGINSNDEIITTPFTFTASADAIRFVGAKPVFVDIDSTSLNINPQKIEGAISSKTKAILVVHLFGRPCQMDVIKRIAQRHNLKIIEDCAQAHGAKYKDRMVGTFGDVACYSFYATKNATTGEGGMVVTNNKSIAEQIRMLKNHGQKQKYIYKELGYNYAMTEIQGVLGIEQLKKLDQFNRLRNKNARLYNKLLSGVPNIEIPQYLENEYCCFHQYTIRISKRNRIIKSLEKKHIGYGIHYPLPLHLQPSYRYLGYRKGDLPISEKTSREIISLPIHPLVTTKNIITVCKTVKNAIKT